VFFTPQALAEKRRSDLSACLCVGCSLQGTKWTATKWIHNKPYGGGFDALKQAASCSDVADDCT
jgi:prolyl 4-hydroxylase